MTIPRVKPGDPLTAAGQNELIDQMNRQSLPGGVDGRFGSTGADWSVDRPADIVLFEIVGSDWSLPDLTAISYYSSTVPIEQSPSITARRVEYAHHVATDLDSSSDPVYTYNVSENREETIYHPISRFTPSAGTTPRAGYGVGPIGIGQGDRVWCVWNRQSGRWEILADSESTWLKVWNESAETIPAYGIVTLEPDTLSYCTTLAGSITRSVSFPGLRLAINGPSPIPAGGYGRVTLGERPTRALYDSTTDTPAAGDDIGPGTTGYALMSGLPGFRFLNSVSGDSSTAWVIRDRQSVCRGVATDQADGGDTKLRIRPISSSGAVYDGTARPSLGPIWCFFPGKIDSRDLNVQIDDMIYYRVWPPGRSGFESAIAYGDYWDDAMGTIRMMTAGSTIPRGWRQYAALNDKFPRGDNTGGTGGTANHNHNLSAGFNLATGTDLQIDNADHLPPYKGVLFIERYM